MRNSQRHNPSGSGDNDQGRKKEFNAKVFWRLLSGLKKHFLWVALALSALAASTLGDLMVPVIIQRTLDENILAGLYPRGSEFPGLSERRGLRPVRPRNRERPTAAPGQQLGNRSSSRQRGTLRPSRHRRPGNPHPKSWNL
jgi:hypothetical protein